MDLRLCCTIEFQVDSAAPNRRGFRLAAATDTLHMHISLVVLVVLSCVCVKVSQPHSFLGSKSHPHFEYLWVVLESSQCRRSSICYAQFKLLAEQHNFRTYLSATQLRFMEMIGDVCFHPNLHIAWHFWQSESTGRRVPFARDSCCTWQLRL